MKTTMKRVMIAMGMALMAVSVKAQQVPLFNQYYHTGSLAYPSSTVFNQDRYISLVYRDQFGGVQGAPTNFALAYNSAYKNNKAFNLNITSADVGFTNQVRFSGGMGYKLFGEGQDGLSLGAQASFSLIGINEELFNPEDPDDNALEDLVGQNGYTLGLDFTASYRKGNFGVDIALPSLLTGSFTDDSYVEINDDNLPDFIGGLRYEFAINPDISVTPYAGVRYQETVGTELDVLAEVNFKEKFMFMAGYRDNYGPTVGFGAQVFEKLLFTYNYDFGDKDTPFLSDGFNEFGLHYKLNSQKKKPNDYALQGKAVVDKIIDEKIFDQNLMSFDERELALFYLRTLETGKRKEKNEKAEEAYQALFAKVKAEELNRVEALRVAALHEEQVKQEQARLAQEQLAAVEEAKREALIAQKEQEEVEEMLTLATNTVKFNSGSAVLKEESYAALAPVLAFLQEKKEVTLSLAGFTDSSGNADKNLSLSKARAHAVKDYLISKGVDSERIVAEGYGNASPRANNETPEGRALNRRVEIKVVEE